MKRLLRNSSGRSASMDHQNSNNNNNNNSVPPPSPQAFASSPRRMGRSNSLGAGAASPSSSSNDLQLPNSWCIQDDDLRSSDPFSVRIHSRTAGLKTTVYSNTPLPPMSQFIQSENNNRNMHKSTNGSRKMWGVRRRSGDASNGSNSNSSSNPMYPTLSEQGNTTQSTGGVGAAANTKVYYFEVTMSSSGRHSRDSFDVMIGFADEEFQAAGIWPGEVPSSIGWGSNGLFVDGRHVSDGSRSSSVRRFANGDTIGCGIETSGMHRVFFTHNGRIIVQPSTSTTVGNSDASGRKRSNSRYFPVVAFQQAGGGGVLKGNFGLDRSYPFRWLGDASLRFLAQQPGGCDGSNDGQTVSMGSLPSVSRSRSPSPYSGLDVSVLDNDDDALTRSMRQLSSPSLVTTSPGTARIPVAQASSPRTAIQSSSSSSPTATSSPAVYGTRKSRQNLEDDDPTANANLDHFNVARGNQVGSPPAWMTTAGGLRQPGTPGTARSPDGRIESFSGSAADADAPALRRLDSSRRRREERAQQRRATSRSGSGYVYQRTHTGTDSDRVAGEATSSPRASASDFPPSVSSPRLSNSSDRSDPASNENSSGISGNAGHVAGDELLTEAKMHSTSLLEASKVKEADFALIRSLLDNCKQDQEKLQVKLSTALEEADAIDNLEELFAVNDGICSAIEAGNDALKKEKASRRRSSMDGPTIDVLVQNEDIFSLICMLRAPNEKRLQAALALMDFAKGNEVLRNEIRSSGGMHSFLTLYRTRGMTRELQVVASMAVAYTLPSFVASSQTSSTVGLRIMECLRFLVTANPVSPNGVVISRDQMCQAASSGVNALWINAIHPLIAMEKVKKVSSNTRPALNPSQSIRFGRAKSRAGGGLFDQGQESIEIQELTESAVTLIAHLVKLSQTGQVRIDVGYNIIEQVCEIDEARPIAVREGLLTIFVDWIRSGDINKIRPAASALRYLISIHDKYMAGWIHSQVVNEDAIREIVKLLNESVGHDVRVAVAQMLSALCIAPHTRAAVIEANCVSYLVALLYEHTAPDSDELVYCAGSALLQLAACSMMSTGGAVGLTALENADDSAKHADVVNEIVEGWAHGSFVQIALEHDGKLRSVSIEALRILSEDTHASRRTRLQLCNAGAAEALGSTIKKYESTIQPLEFDHLDSSVCNTEGPLLTAIKDTYESLCGLANILEPLKSYSSRKAESERRLSGIDLNPKELLIKGCLDVAKSGGLKGVLWLSGLPYTPSSLSKDKMLPFDRTDLLEESCRLLANLSPLLLSDSASSEGVTKWAGDVFEALDGILKRFSEDNGDILLSNFESVELNINALKGIMALAFYEPLKIRIVNRALPRLLSLKGMGDERNDLATAANQVLISLGFTEDEITVQVAGNSPQLLVDWFCLQRALLLQAMARAEIRARVLDLWQLPFSETDTEKLEEMSLIRQISARTDGSNNSSCGSEDDPVIKDLFSSFTGDYDSRENIATVTKQYQDVYEEGNSRRINPMLEIDRSRDGKNEDLMSLHSYPLNDINEEMEWILQHRQAMDVETGMQKFSVSGVMSERVEKLLDTCFPSKLLRANIVPVNDLLPQSSFNFRALMMPKRRYFSFRREGQLLARLCDKQAKDIDSDAVHWTLGFTNSTFAGEFVESLVQSLYLCPMISGLSFARSSDWMMMSDSERESDSDEGGGLLANLTGSLPPWVTHLIFDNMLNDRDLRALVAILETMGRLSSGQDDDDDSQISIGQSQGKFTCFGIRNSVQISREIWSTFFQTLGKVGPLKRNPSPSPLSSLKILDLSGNKMGDEAAAMVLELVHDKDSGCSLEQLDLSGNRIGRGANVIRVLCAYTEYYRYNQTVGVKMMRKGWKASLHTLVLAENDLFLGQAGLEILALLKHNALCLRYLDLSNNSLEGDTYQLLASSLLKNTALCHLNLSGNKFSPALIDLILDHLNEGDAESGLSFLLFENNVPALNEGHRSKMAMFLRRSRKKAIERHIKESETEPAHADEFPERHDGELELIDEDTSKILSRRSFDGGRRRGAAFANDSEVEPDSNMITVLFSAPLVFSSGENELHPFAKLDFEMERELLWQCMKEASRDIEMSFDNAHHSRLLATLTKRCSVLHYSGHGHPKFLPFEDGMGGPNWLDVQDIKELILQDGVVPFKFVFVSACHSGLAGETFASAGVPHVVCCKQEFELKDAAALAFTRSFYLALLVGHTVRESFEQGCKAVRATPNLKNPDKEMEKFVLLPKDGDHNVPVFKAKPIREWPKQSRNQGLVSQKSSRRRGSRSSLLMRMKSSMALGAKSSELSVRNMMQEDPSPTAPQFFLGREVEMYYVISALLKLRKRLVTIYGETGMGRSSLACAICHYINERASTVSDIQHIYFIKAKHGGQNVSCRSILRQLLDKLEENGKCRPTDEEVDTEAMLNLICRSLKQDKCLIVFDRTELLEESDESQEMPMILSTILYETKQVKVIITARNALGQPSIGGQVEHPYNLGPLTFTNAVKLFANLCPHLHTPSERGQLSKLLVRNEDQEDLLPNAATAHSRTKTIFSMIGDGIPAKIEKCAYSISADDLARLQDI